MVFIQSEKCHNDGVSRPPIRDNDLDISGCGCLRGQDGVGLRRVV